MKLVFATCEHKPLVTADDQVLADALRIRGVDVTPIPWTELDPYSILDSPPIVLRSTWDYHRVPTMFKSWLRSLGDSGRATWNPAGVAIGNVDKIYLQTLANAGIAIPRTRWIDDANAESLRAALAEERWPRAVLKPRIAATAYGTFLVDPETVLSRDDLAPARASGALLQEVIPEVAERGEVSMVYIGGAFSHSVLKTAHPGEFRVQQDFGGRVAAISPAPALVEFADRVMTHVPTACLYARVDVVDSARGPLLMELEVIEPELYFLIAPEAADRMADILVERLHP